MLKVINRGQVKAFRADLRAILKRPGHEIHHRRLGTPGRRRILGNRQLYWQPELGLWAYFHDKMFGRDGKGWRWPCWFGTDVGNDRKTLVPSVEINLALEPSSRRVYGRAQHGRNRSRPDTPAGY